jgi:hypothetical protein
MTKSETTLRAKLAVLILAQPENAKVYINITQSLDDIIKEKDNEKAEMANSVYQVGTKYFGLISKSGNNRFYYAVTCEEKKEEELPPNTTIISFHV